MWIIVEKQLKKTRLAFLDYDKAMARQVIAREKMVNALELKIDSECESFIAKNSPVAIDLRLVLAYINMNNNLERIGDFCESISNYVLNHMSGKLDENFAALLRIEEIFDCANDMFIFAKDALIEEDTEKAEKIFGIDNLIDEIYHNSVKVIAEQIKNDVSKTEEYLLLYSVIRKLERIGDRCNNIAEEIVFYLEAKVLKHNEKEKKKIEKDFK
jgi:phosphate transport system protein